jgi:hypothetical protein
MKKVLLSLIAVFMLAGVYVPLAHADDHHKVVVVKHHRHHRQPKRVSHRDNDGR